MKECLAPSIVSIQMNLTQINNSTSLPKEKSTNNVLLAISGSKEAQVAIQCDVGVDVAFAINAEENNPTVAALKKQEKRQIVETLSDDKLKLREKKMMKLVSREF